MFMSHRKIVFVAFIILAIVIAFFGALSLRKTIPVGVGNAPVVMCTMEAKLCPDGSAVGRHGPRCEFDLCPVPVSIATSTYKNKAIAIFEGTWELPYELSYDPAHIIISTTSNNNQILITDTISNATATLLFSYEGGRGYSVEDYFKDVILKKCISCKSAPVQFTNVYLSKPLAYTDAHTTYVVSAIVATDVTTEPWLAVITYSQSDSYIIPALTSFRIVKAASSESRPQPY